MSRPSLPNAKSQTYSLPDYHQRQSIFSFRLRQTKHLIIFIALICLIIQGCTGTQPPTLNQPEEEPPEAIANAKGSDIFVNFAAPIESVQKATATPAVFKYFASQEIPSPTPLSAESILTPEPTFTPTPVIFDTATPTLTPSPVAPTATDTPLPTFTPFPTATSQPVATESSAIISTSEPELKHVIIISIDGLRPDALFAALTPNIDSLIERGAYSPQAQTIMNSVTLPSHASMVSGMVPEKHGILWGLPYIGWPGMNGPTLFNVVHDAGHSTGMIFGKEKLNYLVLGDSVDKLFGVDAHDPEIKEQAIEFIEEGLPEVLFIHFPDTDRVGHAYGWMSSNQFQSVTFVDGLIGEIVAALENEGYLDSTLIILTADHGGHGFAHGDDSPEDRTIPWLAVGPGVAKGVTLGSNINTYDTAATVLYALELPIPEKWDGKPVLEIFEDQP